MTIGVLIVAAVVIHMGLPYSDVLGDVYIALSSAMACRVFRMLMLCRWETEDVTLSTWGVEVVLMAGMAAPESASRASDIPIARRDTPRLL